MARRSRLPLSTCLLAFMGVALATSSAVAQVGEVTVGAVRAGGFPSADGAVYRYGVWAQGGLYGNAMPSVRIGAELTASVFDRNEPFPAPCPVGPVCDTRVYADERSELVSLAAAAQLSLDQRGRFFVTSSAGAYYVNLTVSRLHAGLSAGLGATMPFGERGLWVVEAKVLGLINDGNGPAQFIPLAFGFRY